MRTLFDVRAHALGDVGELVHETDLGGEHGVRRVLGELRGADVHHDEPVVIADKGFIQRAHELRGTRIVSADHHAIGLHEVRNRRALLEELRIGHHVELDLGLAPGERLHQFRTYLIGRAYGYGGFRDDDAIAVQVRPDGACHRENVAQVGGAVLSGWRTHGDELEQAVVNPPHRIRGELDAPGFRVALDERVQSRLVDGDLTALQALDLGGVHVHADHVITGICQTRAGHQTHVARAENGHAH